MTAIGSHIPDQGYRPDRPIHSILLLRFLSGILCLTNLSETKEVRVKSILYVVFWLSIMESPETGQTASDIQMCFWFRFRCDRIFQFLWLKRDPINQDIVS